MNKVLVLMCLALIPFLAGCAGSRSLVVLLPDSDGNVGAIHVETTRGAVTMDAAYTAVSAARNRTPLPPEAIEKREIESSFAAAMAIEPPQRFRMQKTILYFPHDATHLTPVSVNVLHETIHSLIASPPLQLYVVGHADRVGETSYNMRLSRERAVAIGRKLVSEGVDPAIVTTCFLGDTKPLIDAPATVSEPRNRRVELIMKYQKPD